MTGDCTRVIAYPDSNYINAILRHMSIVVVVLLVVLWAWILLPGAVRERRDTSPATSVSRFERSMAQLGRIRLVRSVPEGTGKAAPEGAGETPRDREVWLLEGSERSAVLDAVARAARRRRQVLTGLTATTTMLLISARIIGGFVWALFWFASVLLLIYLVLLAHRWVRISRAAAIPLVRPPALDGSGLAEHGHQLRGSGHVRDVGDLQVKTEAVRVVEW